MFAAKVSENVDPRHVPELPNYRSLVSLNSVESYVRQKPQNNVIVPNLNFQKTSITESSHGDVFTSSRPSDRFTRGAFVNIKN